MDKVDLRTYLCCDKYLKVTGSDVENPRQPRQSRLKAIFEAKME